MQLNNNQQLFIDSTIEMNKQLYNLTEKQVKQLLLLQKETRDEILSNIANIMLEFTITENQTMNLTSEDKIKLNTQIGKLIDDRVGKEVKNEVDKIETLLIDIAKDKYYMNSFIFALGINFELTKISDKQLKKIIKEKVKGELWSDRIWSNKNQLQKVVRKEIYDFINGKVNVNQISKKIKDLFNQNAYNTSRLVETEIARVMEKANDIWQEDLGIEYVMYSTALDNKVCSKCERFADKIYKTNEKPVELPQHPKDRCTYIALPDKEWKPKTRRDHETNETINYTTYKEWKEKNKL